MAEYMLTTTDNPYNPFTEFDEWFALDTYKGYNTCAYLARVVRTSEELSEEDQQLATADAIRSILDTNVIGVYRLVDKDFNPYIMTEKDLLPSIGNGT